MINEEKSSAAKIDEISLQTENPPYKKKKLCRTKSAGLNVRRNERMQIAFECVENFGDSISTEVTRIKDYLLNPGRLRSFLRRSNSVDSSKNSSSPEQQKEKEIVPSLSLQALNIKSPKSNSLPNLQQATSNTTTDSGLNDFVHLVVEENDGKNNEDNDDHTSNNKIKKRRNGSVKLRCEYFGMPESDCAFDAGHVVTASRPNLHNYRSSSSSSYATSTTAMGYYYNCAEQCEEKYAELSREIFALKAQIVSLTKKSSTTATTIATTSANPPPPPPPLPPADFFARSVQKSAVVVSYSTKRQMIEEISDENQIKRQRMMLEILQDLESGRANLKPVAKSPGGTPRRHSLAVYRAGSTRNGQNSLAEALKRKFANVVTAMECSPLSENQDHHNNSSTFDHHTTSFDFTSDEER